MHIYRVGTFGTVIVHDGDENDKVVSQLNIGNAEPPTTSIRDENLSVGGVKFVGSRYLPLVLLICCILVLCF